MSDDLFKAPTEEEIVERLKKLVFCGECKHSYFPEGYSVPEYARCSRVKDFRRDFYGYSTHDSRCRESNSDNLCTRFEKKEEQVEVATVEEVPNPPKKKRWF